MKQENLTRRKMELTRLIREENRINRGRIRAREEILYGKKHQADEPDPAVDYFDEYDRYGSMSAELPQSPGEAPMSSFGLRFFLAVLLFCVYFVCKATDSRILGADAAAVEEAVSGNMPVYIDVKIDDIIRRFTSSLSDF